MFAEFPGRVIAALAADPDVMRRSAAHSSPPSSLRNMASPTWTERWGPVDAGCTGIAYLAADFVGVVLEQAAEPPGARDG